MNHTQAITTAPPPTQLAELLPEWERDSEIVRSGSAIFVEVGRALARIRASASYRAAGYSTFEEATKALTGHGRHQARHLMRAAETVDRLSDVLPALTGDGDHGHLTARALRPLGALSEPLQREALRRAEQLRVDEGASAITNQHTSAAVAELRHELGGKAPRAKGEAFADGHDSDEVGTPPEIIKAAKKLMGEITFDPFTSKAFNAVVGAQVILRAGESAFDDASWWSSASIFNGSWWVNPPYSRASEALTLVLEKLAKNNAPDKLTGYRAEACILVNTDTGTVAQQAAAKAASAVVLLSGRLDWWWTKEDGTKHTGGGGRSSSVLYYIGHRTAAEVHAAFGHLGVVLSPFGVVSRVRAKEARGPRSAPAKPRAEGSNEAPPRRTIAELDLEQYRELAAGLEVEVSWPGAATGTDSRRGRFERVTSKGSVGVRLYHVTPKGEVTERLGSVRWFPPSEVCLLERPRGRKRG